MEEFLIAKGFGDEVRSRFSGFMRTMNQLSGANAIHEWCRTGFLGFTADDQRAFSSVRNKTAHGKLNVFGNEEDSKQEALAKRDRIYNMFNKLILHAMGYTGSYFDYSRWAVSQWPV